MISITLLIPLTDNSGQPFSEAQVDEWEVYLTETLGGFTRLPGLGRGGWMNKQGNAQIENHRQYAVGIDGLLGQATKLLSVVSFAKKHFGQDEIGVGYLGVFEAL